MDADLAWMIVGLVLVITELVTSTFYLLMLGIAAFGAALAAWLGFDFAVQSTVATIVAAAGSYGVHAYRAKNRAQQMAQIDSGMPASFEAWVDTSTRLARVRYRGASWDARVAGAEPLESGATVYVIASDGNTLNVSKNRPAA